MVKFDFHYIQFICNATSLYVTADLHALLSICIPQSIVLMANIRQTCFTHYFQTYVVFPLFSVPPLIFYLFFLIFQIFDIAACPQIYHIFLNPYNSVLRQCCKCGKQERKEERDHFLGKIKTFHQSTCSSRKDRYIQFCEKTKQKHCVSSHSCCILNFRTLLQICAVYLQKLKITVWQYIFLKPMSLNLWFNI